MKRETVIDVLKTCYDPEIPIDLWNLGLIYDIDIQPRAGTRTWDVAVTMSLTTPGCSLGSVMAQDVKTRLEKLDEVHSADVLITFDPPWDPSRLSPEARKQLGLGATTNHGEKEENHAWE